MNNSLSRHENLIPTTQLIILAKKAGFNFGPGNPNNRLRYYTKIGLIPHAQRKQVGLNSFTVGHYPASVLDQLLKIQDLKKTGKSFEEIYRNISQPPKNSRSSSLSFSLRGFAGIFLLIFSSALITLLLYSPIKTSLNISDLSNGQVAAAETSMTTLGVANFCRQ